MINLKKRLSNLLRYRFAGVALIVILAIPSIIQWTIIHDYMQSRIREQISFARNAERLFSNVDALHGSIAIAAATSEAQHVDTYRRRETELVEAAQFHSNMVES